MKTTVVNIRETDDYDVYIGRKGWRRDRRFPASIWANPYKVGQDGSRAEVIDLYRDHLRRNPHLVQAVGELRGKRLGCWCAPKACHGDVLALLAEMTPDERNAWLQEGGEPVQLSLF